MSLNIARKVSGALPRISKGDPTKIAKEPCVQPRDLAVHADFSPSISGSYSKAEILCRTRPLIRSAWKGIAAGHKSQWEGRFCVSILDGVRNIPLSTDPDMETCELRKIFKGAGSDDAVRIIVENRRGDEEYYIGSRCIPET